MNQSTPTPTVFSPGDARGEFVFPKHTDSSPLLYLCGHSLGLLPRDAAKELTTGIDAWARLAVDGHFEGGRPWFELGEDLRPVIGRLVGASAKSVVLHGSLTSNLHLLLTSFYRPSAKRTKFLMEFGAFPSDRHLVFSHVHSRGLDPAEHVIELKGDGPLSVPSSEEVIAAINAAGEELATVLLPGVAYATGYAFDIRAITDAAHKVGATVGFDLAHAAGNLHLKLEEDGVDFAAWCSYKYLNGGPGAIGGLFVHPKHTDGPNIPPRFEGWWGNLASSRFTPNRDFVPEPGAGAWQLSNVPVFSTLPLYASLPIFDRIGMEGIAHAGRELHARMRQRLIAHGADVALLTPEHRHGAQLSVGIPGRADAVQKRMQTQGILVDTRGPDVLRLGAVPLYTTLDDADRAVDGLVQALREV